MGMSLNQLEFDSTVRHRGILLGVPIPIAVAQRILLLELPTRQGVEGGRSAGRCVDDIPIERL